MCVSGDGLLNEVLDGLLARDDWQVLVLNALYRRVAFTVC